MASFQELFDQVVGPLNDPAQFGRQEQVNLVPNQVPTDEQMYQQAAFADYGGDKSLLRSEIERDLVTLKPHEIIGKYGEEIGSDMLRRKYAQSDRYDYDAAATRDLAQAAGDSLVSAISGFGSTIAGPVAALAGIVSPELGATMAGAIDEATAYANSLKSDAVQRRVKMQAARTAVREQQNQAQYEKDVASGESELVASLARIGRDALGGAADVLTDPMQFSELAAQGVGSMAAIPLIGAGIGAGIPTGAATRLIAGAIGPTRTAVKAGRAIEKALPTTAAIGLTEAGGTFVQATNEVMNIPQAEIEKLPAYQERIAAGMKPEEARLDMANDAATQAALMQFPAAIVAGTLVSKFEAAPFARRSVTDVFANLGKETLEEGTQSATSQLAVNQAIKSNVDAKRERTAGVGTQFGVGAVAGFGTAGAIQTPGVIAQGVSDTVGAAKKAVDQRLEGIRKANEQASPVSDDKVAEQATQVETAAPAVQAAVDLDENLTPERKAELNQLVQDVTESAIQLDGDSLAQDESQPPAVREAAAGQSTMVGYLQSLSRIAADEKRPELDRVHAHMALSQTVQAISGFLDQLPDSVQDLTEDHPVREFIGSIQGMNAALMSSPSVSKATEQAPAVMQKAVDANPLTETSDANVAGIHLAAADLAPETATRESVDTLLKMATKGKLQLNEQQYTNLTMLKKLFDNAAAYDEEIKLAGAKPQDTVSRAIKTDTIGVDGDLSALQHAQGIRQALVQGDVEGAKARLEDLGMFAQHMQNKVNAINSHMATKDPTMATAPTYQKLVGTLGNRAFVDSGKPIGVTPTSANSIRQVQLIGAEANFVTNAFNILAETFPQLDIQPMELIELDAQLDGRPEELAAQFTAAKEKAKNKAQPKPTPKSEPNKQETQSAPKAEEKPVAEQELPVTPEFVEQKQTAIRAMSDADLSRHLKTLTNSLMQEESARKAKVIELIQAEQQARADLAKTTEEDDTPPWDTSEEPVTEPAKNMELTPKAEEEAAPEATDLSGYTNHSGGAKGSDSVWDIIGRSFGLGQSLHYYGEGSKTPLGNTPLTSNQLAEADPALIRANKSLGRHYPPKNAYVRSLLQRNYYQVRNSDAVYAIGNIAGKLVEGGTGWAVQMAIDMAKPVYVFNQKDNLWYTFSNGQFVQTDTPVLTKNFAGIGTREITKAGEQGIREVYEKTLSELGKAPAPAPTKKSAAPLAEEDKKRGFALNAGQKEALRKIKEFLQDKSKKTFSLIGPAGTGKTTIVEEILDGLDPKQFRGGVILSSPTHRANAVTRSKNPEAEILTLHKLLGLKPTTDLENFDAKNVKFEESEHGGIPPGSLVVMDESSMINDNLFDYLQDKLRESPGSKIIFLGDSAQLNPVKQVKPSKALTSTSGVAELTTVERAKNAALLDESVSVRESGKFTNESNMRKGNGVRFTNSPADFLNLAIKLFSSEKFKSNLLLGRVLAYTNAKVDQYNRQIRASLFPNEQNVTVGDLLMGYNAFGPLNDKTGMTPIANGVDYLVTATSPVVLEEVLSGVRVPVQTLTLKDALGVGKPNKVKVVANSITAEQKAALEEALGKIHSNAWKRGSAEEEILRAFNEQYALPFDAKYHNTKWNRQTNSVKKAFDFGYAHTIHKSQGGTYDYALVDDVDITTKSRDKSDQARLRYVGLTRAKHGTYVLTNAQITDKTNTATESVEESLPVEPATQSEIAQESSAKQPDAAPVSKQDKWVQEGKAELKNGVYYINEPNLVKNLAGTNGRDVYVDMTRATDPDQVRDYFTKGSEQKAKMLEVMGITAEQFLSLFTDNNGEIDTAAFIDFLVAHEKSHVANNDYQKYPKIHGKWDLMNEAAIAIEVRATEDAFTPEQRANYEEMVESNAAIDTSDKPLPPDTFTKSKKKNPLLDVYPNLIGGARNRFVNAFKLPMNPISNLDGITTPINSVLKWLEETVEDLGALRAFQSVLGDFPNVYEYMNRELNKFMLQKSNQHGRKTIAKLALTGEVDPTIFPNGRGAAIAEFVDGKFVLNEELTAKAYIAGVSWLLNSSNMGQTYDVEEAAKVLNIAEEAVTEEHIAMLSNGVTRLQAVDKLASYIKRYWGVTTDPTVGDEFTKGIPNAVAANIIDMMLSQDFNGEKTLSQVKLDLGPNKDVVIYTAVDVGEDLNKHRDTLEKLVATTPELIVYMGDNKPPVAKTQLNNPNVPNTKPQQRMIENLNDTGYTVNLQTLDAYVAMGIDTIIDLFGEANVDPATTNVNTLATRKGRNKGITKAWDVIQHTYFQIEQEAEDTGQDIDKVEIHYAHNVTSVGRAQQLGPYTPQSSKLVRTVFLPTNSKPLNLTDTTGQDWRAFMLSLGQLLGVKVHNFDPEVTEEKVMEMLNGKYAGMIKVLQDHLDTGRAFSVTELGMFKESLGKKPTFETFQALVDYARFLNTEDKSQYTTQIYLEADGMSNGSFNTMAMFTMGEFTAEQLKNLAKCGLYFGGTPAEQTSWVQRQRDKKDLYETIADATLDNIGYVNAALDRQAEGGNKKVASNAVSYKALQKHLGKMMGLLMDDQVKIDDEGNIIDLTRHIPKNPTTVTNYGSGKKGIASKLTKTLVDRLYARISDALHAQAEDNSLSLAQAMFPDVSTEKAEENLQALKDAMRALTSEQAAYSSKKGEFYTTGIDNANPENLQITTKYTIGRTSFNSLAENMMELMVQPMHQAIESTMHPTTAASVRSLRIMTQAQGIIIANAYMKRANELIAEKQASGYVRGAYLSAKQQQEIFEALAPLQGMMQTGSQNYFVSVSEGANPESTIPYGASFDNKIKPLPTINAPTNPGVKGIAMTVIGFGDGMTIQEFTQRLGNVIRSLPIFDGINLPLDGIQQLSRSANQAAFIAIMANPLAQVTKNFTGFLEELDGKFDVYTDMSPAMKFDLGRAIFGFGFTEADAAKITGEQLMNAMKQVAQHSRNQAISIQARHNVMQSVNFGMDQMAAAGSPYLVTDRIELVGTQEEIANQLTQLYQAELRRLQEEAAILANDINSSRRKDLQDIGVQTESGAVVLTGDAIRGLVDRIKNTVPRSQQLVLTQAIKNVLADGYKVISGSYDQLMAYNQNLGANGIDASRIDPDSDQGITLPDRKEIWLLNPDSEVLAHEFVHAATYSILLSYMHSKYGTGKSSVSAEVGASIDAIEQLMNQFMDMKDEILKANPSDEFFTAYMNARLTIIELMSNKQYSLASRTAAAVNEYMAWSLSNQELVKAQSKIPVRLTTILWETLKNIRNWLFGSTTGRNVDDMLSNLAYHTKVVMSATQPSLSAMTKDTSLMMSRVYGHDQRLADLDRTFDQKVADYVTAQGPVQQARRTNEVALSGINAFHMVGLFSGNGFPMTAQEANTFYKVVAALGTQAKLDPAVMNRMQELYAAATRELTVESFMRDPQGNNPADYAQAEKKYEVVMGQRGVGKDPIGRSTLMPAFMALALTNDTFREVLAKLPVPRTEASTQERAFDRLLENQANKMLDQLSDVLSGQKRSATVQQAIDNLAYQLVDAAQQSQGFYDQYVTPLGTLADKANATIVESMNKVADKFTTLAEQRRQAGKDRKLIDSAINNGLEVAASIINEEKAGLLGEAILAGANASQSLPKWLHDLVADLVGRVDSNADLYDMIKKVRSSIQRLRNQFRTELPKTLAKQFTRKVTKEEWTTMHNALGKTDLAAVVQNGSFTRTDTLAMLGNQPALNRGIRKLEDEIKALDSKFATQYLDKAQQLATFMMTGVPGQHLARNARAIARRLGTKNSTLNVDPALERAIDSLVSLYAVNKLSDADKQAIGSLAQSQKAGVEFTFGYALGLHNQELSRLGDSVNGQAFVNHYKGHMPTLQQDGVSLRISDDKEFVKLLERSYVRKAAYAQSSLDRSAPQSYYFAPVNGRSNFNQGIVQNVRQTMGGVDSITGYTVGGLTGGRITDYKQVARIAATLSSGRYAENGSNLLPVYNAKGAVVAYERSADPAMLQALNYNTNFGEVMGAWKGRLAEETLAVQSNQVSVEYMAEMYRKDTANNSANKAQYVDLFDGKLHNKYPVIEDALKLFTPSTVDAIHAQFPDGHFWVRKDMLDNVIGYRSATVGDAWTGNTYWSKETQEAIRKTAMLAFGNKAYANFVNAEQTVQGVVQDAKTLIIIKSIVVPVANMMSNMLQLVARGVPVRSILVGLPKKLAETRQYVASEKRAIEAEAELHATTDAAKQRRLKVEIQSIRDSYKRMSIWPLIERGELSSMSDDAQPEDQELVAGKLNAFIEAQVNKLPPAIRAAGKYALITKDTALYKGLRKSVEYGDFLAKAILWDDLVNRQGKNVEYANGRITEEFVNFDRLGGRNRQYLEAMGLLWFYNFKIRAAKVGLSIIRNNPLHALMAAAIPAPASIGSPITDNLFGLAVEGKLGHSIGLDQLISAPMLHPLDNLIF